MDLTFTWGAVVVIALVAFWLGESRGQSKAWQEQEAKRCRKCEDTHRAEHLTWRDFPDYS